MHTPWAVRYARVHGTCSADRLASAFNIAPDIAQTLMGRLHTNGIVGAPGMGGLAKALDPISFDLQFSGRVAASQAQAAVNGTAKLPDMDLDNMSQKSTDVSNEAEFEPAQKNQPYPADPPLEEDSI